jgi:hypothetical protein
MTQTNPITCSLKEEFAVKYLALPTKKQLEKLFDWDETGSLRWKVNRGTRARVGNEAGTLGPNGYLGIKLNGQKYQKHRLLFVLYYGKHKLGDKKIDHIDGNKLNNAKFNLRIETTINKNIHNSKKPKNNTSGCKGVCWDKNANKWHARIGINNKNISLGIYTNFIYACVVRRRAAKLYHGDWRRD